ADHSFLIRIRDPARLQVAHGYERLVDLRAHLIEEIIRKFHPADVDREIEIVVAQKVLLKSLPERRRSHKVSDEWQVTSDEFSLISAICHLSTCHMSQVTCHLPVGGFSVFCSVVSRLIGTSSFGATSYSGFATPSNQ